MVACVARIACCVACVACVLLLPPPLVAVAVVGRKHPRPTAILECAHCNSTTVQWWDPALFPILPPPGNKITISNTSKLQ